MQKICQKLFAYSCLKVIYFWGVGNCVLDIKNTKETRIPENICSKERHLMFKVFPTVSRDIQEKKENFGDLTYDSRTIVSIFD